MITIIFITWLHRSLWFMNIYDVCVSSYEVRPFRQRGWLGWQRPWSLIYFRQQAQVGNWILDSSHWPWVGMMSHHIVLLKESMGDVFLFLFCFFCFAFCFCFCCFCFGFCLWLLMLLLLASAFVPLASLEGALAFLFLRPLCPWRPCEAPKRFVKLSAQRVRKLYEPETRQAKYEHKTPNKFWTKGTTKQRNMPLCLWLTVFWVAGVFLVVCLLHSLPIL